MLILTRKRQHTIELEIPPSDQTTKVVVKVVDIQGNRSRIGIGAPSQVKVLRGELVRQEARA